jgi:hypothetical protein
MSQLGFVPTTSYAIGRHFTNELLEQLTCMLFETSTSYISGKPTGNNLLFDAPFKPGSHGHHTPRQLPFVLDKTKEKGPHPYKR